MVHAVRICQEKATIPAKIVGTLRRFPHIFSTDPPSPQYTVELRRIFATFGVKLECASLDQPFLPTNQHCFGKEGGREARTGRFARITKNAMELFQNITFCWRSS